MPSLKLSNLIRRRPDAPTLKERASALKATAARVIRRRLAVEVTKQPSPASLPGGSAADTVLASFSAQHQERQDLDRGDLGCTSAAGEHTPHQESAMGRHETFDATTSSVTLHALSGLPQAELGRARLLAEPSASLDLPPPGSVEAMAAFHGACTEFDRRTHISDDEFNRLRIGDTLTLWTSDKVRSAIARDFSDATSSAEALAMAAMSRADLQDLLVLTLRRDLQFEEASRDTRIHEMFALAYAEEAEKPEEDIAEGGDPILAAINEHKAAYAAWLPHLILTSELDGADSRKDKFEAAAEAPYWRTKTALDDLSETMPTTLAGLVALADYLPGAVLRDGSVDDDCRALQALGAVCSAIKDVLGADADLIALGHRFDALHSEWLAAEEANREPASRCEAELRKAEHLTGAAHTAAARLAWSLPGVSEAHQAKEDAFEAIEPIAEAILKLPASTPAGFAAKTRALIWGVWPDGQYGQTAEDDLGGHYGKRCIRFLIESSCAAASVDWRGQPLLLSKIKPKA